MTADWPENCVDCGATECSCVEDAQTSARDQALSICAELPPYKRSYQAHTVEWYQKHGYFSMHTGEILDRLVAWIRWPGADPLVETTARIGAALGMGVAATRESVIACMTAFDVDTMPEPNHPLPWSHDERMALILRAPCPVCGTYGAGRHLRPPAVGDVGPVHETLCDWGGEVRWSNVLVVMDWLAENGAWSLVHEWRPEPSEDSSLPDTAGRNQLRQWLELHQLDSVTGDPEFRRACERVSQEDGGTIVEAAHKLGVLEWRWEGDDLLVESHPVPDPFSPLIRNSNHWRTYRLPPPSYREPRF